MSNTTSRDYIDGDNLMLEKPPFNEGNAFMHGFLVKGDKDALQAIIDTNFNQVAPETCYFKVLTSYVIQSFTLIEHANSLDEKEIHYGYTEEKEVIPWIIVGKMVGDDHDKIDHIFFYPYACFVNSALALNTGREIYGYPKYMGDTVMPTPGSDSNEFSLAVNSYKTFSKETKLQFNPLIRITQETDKGDEDDDDEFGFLDGFEILMGRLVQLIKMERKLFSLDWHAIEQIASLLINPKVDQLFLKQIPDLTGKKALYQGIITAPAVVKKVRSIHCSRSDYCLTIEDNASFPLVKSLGLTREPDGNIKVDYAFTFDFDFVVEIGEEIARADTSVSSSASAARSKVCE